MSRKNYEFWSKFHNFWSPIEFSMNFHRIYTIMSIFQKGLTKFNWICKPNSFLDLNPMTWMKSIQTPCLNKFRGNPIQTELNLIYIWIIHEKMKNFTIPSGPTAAHGHSGSLDRIPARTAQILAFGRPMPSGARPAHSWHVVTARCTSSARGTRRCSGGLSVTRCWPTPSTTNRLQTATPRSRGRRSERGSHQRGDRVDGGRWCWRWNLGLGRWRSSPVDSWAAQDYHGH
jgi:hypothetical protein